MRRCKLHRLARKDLAEVAAGAVESEGHGRDATLAAGSFGVFEGVDVDDVGVRFVGVRVVADEVFMFPFGSFGGGLDAELCFLAWFAVAAWCHRGLGGGIGCEPGVTIVPAFPGWMNERFH
jgi:hypothetical protein